MERAIVEQPAMPDNVLWSTLLRILPIGFKHLHMWDATDGWKLTDFSIAVELCMYFYRDTLIWQKVCQLTECQILLWLWCIAILFIEWVHMWIFRFHTKIIADKKFPLNEFDGKTKSIEIWNDLFLKQKMCLKRFSSFITLFKMFFFFQSIVQNLQGKNWNPIYSIHYM